MPVNVDAIIFWHLADAEKAALATTATAADETSPLPKAYRWFVSVTRVACA